MLVNRYIVFLISFGLSFISASYITLLDEFSFSTYLLNFKSYTDRLLESIAASQAQAGLEDGCPNDGDTLLNPPNVIDLSQKAAVRCCSDDDIDCITPKPCLETSYNQAEKKCSKLGRRLCTAAEMAENKCCGTGCGFDDKLTWYADPDQRISNDDTESTTSFTNAKDSTTSISMKLEPRNKVNIRDDIMVPALEEEHPKKIILPSSTTTTARSNISYYYPVLFSDPKNDSKPNYGTTASQTVSTLSYVKKVVFRQATTTTSTASPYPRYIIKKKNPNFFSPTGSPEYVTSPNYSNGPRASPTRFFKHYSQKSTYKGDISIVSFLKYLYEMGSKALKGWQAAFGDVISQSRKWEKSLNQ